MNMLNIDPSDVKLLTPISEKDALEFLKENTEVILRVSAREFFGVDNVNEYESKKALKDRGVYNTWELYID